MCLICIWNLYVYLLFGFFLQWTPSNVSVPLLNLVDKIFQLKRRGWLRWAIFMSYFKKFWTQLLLLSQVYVFYQCLVFQFAESFLNFSLVIPSLNEMPFCCVCVCTCLSWLLHSSFRPLFVWLWSTLTCHLHLSILSLWHDAVVVQAVSCVIFNN